MLKSPEILVPVDFSPCSVNALRVAIGMAGPDGDLTLLHAIDEQFVSDAVSAALGTAEEIRSRLREQAEANFTNILEGLETEQVNIERMIVVGAPFLEILKIARDLDLQAGVARCRWQRHRIGGKRPPPNGTENDPTNETNCDHTR